MRKNTTYSEEEAWNAWQGTSRTCCRKPLAVICMPACHSTVVVKGPYDFIKESMLLHVWTFTLHFSFKRADLGISIDSKSVDQVTTNQTWLFQSMKHFSNLAYLKKKWPFLVLDNWKVVTNFLVKTVTQVLLFSDVTAFNSLSADFRSILVPRSVLKVDIPYPQYPKMPTDGN